MNVVVTGEARPARIESIRTLARLAHERQDAELLAGVWAMFEQLAPDLLAAAGGTDDLPRWQELALDFETALREVDAAASAAARRLAAEIRTAVTMIERNPADQIARRPTAVRVLQALAALGGLDCSLSEVRAQASMSATHMSNILKALSAHGLVSVATAQADGRERRLSLTSKGKLAVEGAGRDASIRNYRDHLEPDTSHDERFRKAVRRRSSTSTTSTCRAVPSFRSSLETA